jgi:hypothetical protein
VYGCVVLVTFVMFWMSRSAAIESVKSAFSVEVEVEVTIIKFYQGICQGNHMTCRCQKNCDIVLNKLVNFILKNVKILVTHQLLEHRAEFS